MSKDISRVCFRVIFHLLKVVKTDSKHAKIRAVTLFMPGFVNNGQLVLLCLGELFWLWSSCSIFDHVNSLNFAWSHVPDYRSRGTAGE